MLTCIFGDWEDAESRRSASGHHDLRCRGRRVGASSLRHEFPGDWYRFLNSLEDSARDQTLTIELTEERFPFITINTIVRLSDVGQSLYVASLVYRDFPDKAARPRLGLDAH